MNLAVYGGILSVLELLVMQEADGELREDESHNNDTDDLMVGLE